MFHITRAFENTRTDQFRCLWCDGILLPDDNQLALANVISTKQILTRGYFGYDGQGMYWFIFKLGPKALQAYQEGRNLTDYVPGNHTTDWIGVDMENREIELRLQ